MIGRAAAIWLVITLTASGIAPVFARQIQIASRQKPPSIVGKLFGYTQQEDSPPPVLDEADENRAELIPHAPITARDYDNQLSILQTDINSAVKNNNGPSFESSLKEAQADISPITRCAVMFQDTIVVVDNRPMRSTLARLETMKSANERAGTLMALNDQITLIRQGLISPGASAATASSAKAAAAILRKREFASDPVSPPSAFQQKMTDWGDAIGKWLSKHFPKLKGSMPDFSVNFTAIRMIMYVIGGIALALLAFLLVRAIIGMIGPARQTSDLFAGQTGLAISEQERQLVASRDFTKLMQVAAQRADNGDYRDAFRVVYLAKLVLLDSSGDLRIHRSRTNWEYLKHIDASGKVDIHGLLEPVTSEFDRIWYGYGTVGRAHYEEAVRSYEAIRSIILARTPMATSGRQAV